MGPFKSERGSTLVYVLLMMVLLSFVGLTLIAEALQGKNMTSIREADTKAMYLAEKGVTYLKNDFSVKTKQAQEEAEENHTENKFDLRAFFDHYKDWQEVETNSKSNERYLVKVSDKHYNNEKKQFELNQDGTVEIIGKGIVKYNKEGQEQVVEKNLQQTFLVDYDLDYEKIGVNFASFPKNTITRDFSNEFELLGLSFAKHAFDINLIDGKGKKNVFYPVPNDGVVDVKVLDSLLGFSIGDGDRFEYLRANPVLAGRSGYLARLGVGSATGDMQKNKEDPGDEYTDAPPDEAGGETEGDTPPIQTDEEMERVGNITGSSEDMFLSKYDFKLLRFKPKPDESTNVSIDGSVIVFRLLFMRFNTFRDIDFTQFGVTGDAIITQMKDISWEGGLIKDRASIRNFTFNHKDFRDKDTDELLKEDAGGLFVYKKLGIGNGDAVKENDKKKRAHLGLGGDMYVYDYIPDSELVQRTGRPALLISGADIQAIDHHKLGHKIVQERKWNWSKARYEDVPVLKETYVETYPVSEYYVNGDVLIDNACITAEKPENQINIYAKGKIDIYNNHPKCSTQKVMLHAEDGVNVHTKGKDMTIDGGVIGKRKIYGDGHVTIKGTDVENLQKEVRKDYTLTPVGKKVVAN